jgi:hypothetical protein
MYTGNFKEEKHPVCVVSFLLRTNLRLIFIVRANLPAVVLQCEFDTFLIASLSFAGKVVFSGAR